MITWTSDDSFVIDSVEYVCRPVKGRFPSVWDRFCLLKARWQVDWYAQFLEDLAPRAMIEIGMFDGGSMALGADLVAPHKLVGIDARPAPGALEHFIARRGLREQVRPYYGVDQTDRARLAEIVAAEFGAEPLDLVVDDASHLLDATRVTFDALFPRLRKGGIYVIEDWPMHRIPEMAPPLSLFVLELVLACTDAPRAIANVSVNRNYVLVTRGEAELTSGTFQTAACLGPRARALLEQRV
jgi:hypothetical protein